MEKADVEEIKIGKSKEKEDRWAKWVTKLGSTTKRRAQKIVEKCIKA
jgi:hypothetical protein